LRNDERSEEHIERELRRIREALEDISKTFKQVRDILRSQQSHISVTRISIMPKTIQVGQSATAHITAAKADGSPFLITSADQVSLTAQVPADVSFGTPVINADGSVDIPVTGVNADAGDQIAATVDGIVSAPDTLTITAAAPTTVTLTLQ
jgi:hypothetical protein